VLQNAPRSAQTLPGLTFEAIQEIEPPAKFDLAVFLQEGTQGLGGSVVYQAERFQKQTILTWMRRFETLLQSIITGLDTPVDALEIATDEEKAEQMNNEAIRYGTVKKRLSNKKSKALDMSMLHFSPTRPEEEQSYERKRETDANH
jgi:non-ribosomal peptide synthetase component F